LVDHGGFIHDAVSTQEWSGAAAVHVSIVNWSRKESNGKFLDSKSVPFINSSLKSEIDVTKAVRLKVNLNKCFQGISPVGMGFIVTEEKVKAWIKADPKNQEVLKLFSMGSNLASNPHGKPERWVIDFDALTLEDASVYILPFQHVKTFVKPERDSNRMDRRRLQWWRFGVNSNLMRQAIAPLSFCFAVPRVSKWAIFIPFQYNYLAGDLNIVVASNDFYMLGILTSKVHRLWVKAQSSTLKGDTRYTNTTCFETFPFPALTPQPPLPLGDGEQEGEQEREQERTSESPSEPISSWERGRGEGIPTVLLKRARELRQNQTSTEKIMWECLRDRRFCNAKFRRQHNIGQYIADFYCHEAKLVVEVDGEIHQTQQERDRDRNLWMQSNGLTVLRFSNQAIFNNLEETLQTISSYLPNPSSPSSLEENIRSTMQELHQYRTEQMESKQWGITKLYNEYFHEPASQLYKLHAKLDKLVMQIYEFTEDDDLLEKLLHLNQEVAAKEQ